MRRLLLVLVLLLAVPQAAGAQVVTSRSDALRTGWYPDQPNLSPGQVTGGSFGQLFDTPVEGQVYAQPLVADGTLLVVTEANKAYGLDPVTGAEKWERDLGMPFNPDDIQCGDVWPTVGATATPVIDGDTAYFTAKRYKGDGSVGSFMHALDVRTGTEKTGFPVEIKGAADNAPGKQFPARTQLQRPGLLLLDGVVYAAYGSHCDVSPFAGWVAGVSTTGALKAMWTTETGDGMDGGGIWHAGGGLMSDGHGRIFLATGNFNSPPPGPGNQPPGALGQSVVRLQVQSNGKLKTADFFAPYDADVLDGYDADFGSGGPVALPSKSELAGSPFGTDAYPNLLVAVGKVGYVYLLDRDNLGGRAVGGDDDVVARIGPYGGVWSSPAVWPGDGGWVYIPTASPGNVPGGSSGALNFYRAGVDAQMRPTLSLTASTSEAFAFGSSSPLVTSNGMQHGSALVWLIWSPGPGQDGAQLRAYLPDPSGSSDPQPVWSAPVGVATKFTPPGVANGRVYVATADGHVLGYGSPVDPALTGPDVVCGDPVAVGASRQCDATFTARRDVTVTGASSSSAAFAADASSLPRALHNGDTLTIPVTFTPQRTGPAGGSIRLQTSLGQYALGVTGTGLADGPLLTAGTPVLSFGGRRVGQPATGTIIFRNAGSDPLTIDGIDPPAAPFAVSGAPSQGTELQPGEEVTVSVTFAPAAIGDYTGALTVESDGGDVEVGLAGSARTPPRLDLSGSGAFGDVQLGDSAERTVTLTNTGGLRLTVLKSKPPVGGPFRAVTSLAEGTSIAPGASASLTVRFTPAAAGAAQSAWTITADDGSGVREIAFTGAGITQGINETPLTPITPGVTPIAIFKPKLSALRIKVKRTRVSLSFKLDHAAKVRVEIKRGTRVAKRVTISGRRGTNRKTIALRPGRYVLRIAATGGNAGTRRIHVAKLP